jgi:hypothetical protein
VRVVAVFGYSSRKGDGLHPLAAVRVRHAESLAAGAGAVVFSGWSRRHSANGEAELMRAVWAGADVPLICETTARNTAENAAGIAAIARKLGADEVVLVTSRWHAPRASVLVRTVLRGTGITVRASAPRDRPSPRLLARELGCILVLPYHLLRSRVKRG